MGIYLPRLLQFVDQLADSSFGDVKSNNYTGLVYVDRSVENLTTARFSVPDVNLSLVRVHRIPKATLSSDSGTAVILLPCNGSGQTS